MSFTLPHRLLAFFAGLLWMSIFVSSAWAQSLPIGTSFEVPEIRGGSYVGTGNPSSDHDIGNHAGEPVVDFVASGGEIGFDARYVATRGSTSPGLTDGDEIGVTDATGDVSAYPDGGAGYVVSDSDGTLVLTFDPVPLTGATAPSVALDYYIRDTGYESTDRFLIAVSLSGGAEVVLLDWTGDDIDADDATGDANEGAWQMAFANLQAYAGQTATVRVEIDTNAGTEAIYLDRLRFDEASVLPVEMASFSATAQGEDVELRWTTASETGNAGFRVQHRAATATWQSRGFVDGVGTTDVPTAYRFVVSALEPGRHAFRLVQVDHDGTETATDVRRVQIRADDIVALRGANPLVSEAEETLLVQVQTAQRIDAALYNVLGQRVRTLYRGAATPGRPVQVVFTSRGLTSGLYVIRVVGDTFQRTERLSIVQ